MRENRIGNGSAQLTIRRNFSAKQARSNWAQTMAIREAECAGEQRELIVPSHHDQRFRTPRPKATIVRSRLNANFRSNPL
jgi:hypothetical protein